MLPHTYCCFYSLSPCACCGALSVRQSLKTHLKSNDQTTSLHTPERAIECQRLRHAWLTPYTHRERCIYFRFFYMVILDLFRFTGGRQIKTNTFSAEPIKVNFTSHINMYVSAYKHTSVCTLIHHCPTYICTYSHRRQVKFEAMARWGIDKQIQNVRI